MGLDQFANTITRKGVELRKQMLALPTNDERRAFHKENGLADEVKEMKYWRKHADLNEWMTQLAIEKGVVKNAIDFNCTDLVLTPADIDRLEKSITTDNLPHGAGFFWGQSAPEDRVDDEEFIILARQAFERGEQVIYSCWW
jgi:hypothetical protein